MFQQQSLWLIGDWHYTHFAAPLRWLHEHTDCRQFETPATAIAECVQQAPRENAPATIVFAQSRPGEISSRDVELLHAATPLTRLCSLTGPWCEGELRSGRPLPGVTRIPWRRWEPALETELYSSVPAARAAPPRTTTEAERIEHATELFCDRQFRSATVTRQAPTATIFTNCQATYDVLADALRLVGVTITGNLGPAGPSFTIDLAIYDGWEHVHAAGGPQVGSSAPRRLLFLHFPRPDDERAASLAGCDALLAQPLILTDLATTLARVLT